MCTIENEQSILVCDLAIHRVREAERRILWRCGPVYARSKARHTSCGSSDIDGKAFQAVTREAIVLAQQQTATPNQEA